jgi:hypothetical protein
MNHRRVTLRGALLVVGPVGLALLAAGCGGGSKTPGVARIGAATTTAAVSGGSPAGPTPGPAQKADLVAFVNCMQKHGIQAQLGQGGEGISITAGGGPNSPLLQKAQQACQKLLPGGGPHALSPAQAAENLRGLVALASCMRTHGYPNFPDPTGQGVFNLSSGNGFDPNSPQFQAAMTTCQPPGAHLRIGIRASSAAPG